MTPYIRRPHDELLRVVLDPAEPASRLVVLRGDSCTGRSRAVYEAIADRLPDWPVCYPVTTAELGAGVPARTVLWLGELRRHVDADDGATVRGCSIWRERVLATVRARTGRGSGGAVALGGAPFRVRFRYGFSRERETGDAGGLGVSRSCWSPGRRG
jgi:hypothetical protein